MVAFFLGLLALLKYQRLSGLTPTHSLSVAPLESKPFEAPVVVAVATPTLSFLSLRVPIYMTSGRYKVHLFRRGR